MLRKIALLAIVIAVPTALTASTAMTTPEAVATVDPVEARIEAHVRMSQTAWPAGLEELRTDLSRTPHKVISTLIEWLDVDEPVYGEPFESQIYNTCGNALTLLEQLTDVRVCGLGRDWLGFTTHDHRGQDPDSDLVSGPWRAWLAVREDIPVEQWFFGLSAEELAPLQRILRMAPERWDDETIDYVSRLGKRSWPYLLAKLDDNNFAIPDERLCDQANRLLAKTTGLPSQPITAINPLTLPADHPDRATGHCSRRNRALRTLALERWTAALLSLK